MPQETPIPGSAEALGLAAEYDAAADRIFRRADTDNSFCQPYFNDDGEQCLSQVGAAGYLRQKACTLRGEEPFIR